MKNFKAKHPWWYRVVVATIIVIFFNGLNLLLDQRTKNETATDSSRDYRQTIIDGCLNNSQTSNATEMQKQNHCGCVADGFTVLYPSSGTPPTKETVDSDVRIEPMAMECYRKHVSQN